MENIEDKYMTKIEDKIYTQNAKYIIATIAAGMFMTAAYYLPAETFMGFFAAVLFLIPTAFFVYMLQKVHPTDVNK
jgi:hypothetical protein